MKLYLWSGGIVPWTDFGTKWRWVASSRPGRFITRKRDPGTRWIGGWVGPRAGLDVAVKRMIPSPGRDWYPRSSSPYSSAI